MVRVFVETKGHAEEVAIFDDEKLYDDCLPAIEKYAKDNNWDLVTESVGLENLCDLEVKESTRLLIKLEVIKNSPNLTAALKKHFATDFDWIRAGIKNDMIKKSAKKLIDSLVD